MVIGSWAIVQFQQAAKDAGADPADIGYMPFPYQTDQKFHSSIIGDPNTAISIHSKNKVAAHAWVTWFTDKSTYASDSGAIPTLKNKDDPSTLKDFAAQDVKYVEIAAAKNPALDPNIYNKAEIDLLGPIYRQKMIDVARGAAGGTMKSYFADLNKRWAEARAQVKP